MMLQLICEDTPICSGRNSISATGVSDNQGTARQQVRIIKAETV